MDSKYQLTYKRSGDQDKEKVAAYQEAAASVTKLEPYQYGKSSSKHNRERKRWWTKLILTIGSAVLLGTAFGVLLLFIFGQEQEVPALQDSTGLPSREQVNLTETDGQEVSTIELGALSGYVIQVGAFQDQQQAKLAQEQFLADNYQTVIWQTETDFRVFLAAYPSIETAKQVSEQFIEAGYDVYARDWQSTAAEIEGIDHDWVTEFQSLWQQSLTGYSELIEQGWQTWLNVDQTELREPLQAFREKVASILTDFNEQTRPYDLLVLWHDYQQLAK
ncbi:SPOR domain-containing protein [Amphibacillus indicireducens]|uniref:SPOR domain-containing protein n=1 Tax=Amphibacillus indicireducens TaxID=1076330 RepID=A0ABP7VFP8_9BACI